MSNTIHREDNLQENHTPMVNNNSQWISQRQADLLTRFHIGSSTPDLPAFGTNSATNENPFEFHQGLAKVGTETSLAKVSTYDGSLYNGIQRTDESSAKIQAEDANCSPLTKIICNRRMSSEVCKGESKQENLAAVLHGAKDLRIEPRPLPKIQSNQVLLEIEVCGICGTDVHFYKDGRLGPWALKEPMVIGHEASGTVVECGNCVKDLKPGDKVAIEPQVACRICPLCKAGKYHMCPNLYFCAAPPNDGNLCRYFAHDSDFCHKIPCHLDHETGTLMEPLAVGVHACKKGNITCGDSVLVLGSGAIGLASMLAAKAYGAASVIILDIDSFKLKKAMEMGADGAINTKDVPEEEVVKKIHEVIGHPPNKTIDCSGFQAAIRIGMLATGTCGTMVILGLGENNQCLPIMDSVYREIEIIGAIRYANDYATAIDMAANGKVDMRPIVTHNFKFEDAPKAFDLAATQKDHIKVMIHVNPKWQPSDKNCK